MPWGKNGWGGSWGTTIVPDEPLWYDDPTYHFVSATGDDEAAGTYAAPWATVAQAAIHGLNPGDSVYLNRGDTFAETLAPADAGAAGQHIYYGAYGTGAIPIIDGSALSHSLYINNSDVHHLTFQNIHFSGATGAAKETCRVFTHDITMMDCEISGSAASVGLGVWSLAGADSYNNILQRLAVHDNAKSGIYMGADDITYGPHDCLIEYCDCYDNGTVNTADHGIYVQGTVEVRYNHCYGNVAAGIKTNLASEGTGDYATWHPYVHHNLVTGNYFGIICNAPYSTITNNLGYLNTWGLSADVGDYSSIYHNTFASCVTSGIVFNGAGLDNAVIKNNLFHKTSDWAPIFRVYDYAVTNIAANNTWDYNLYYSSGLADNPVVLVEDNANTYTLAQWRALTGTPDVHSVLDDPDFAVEYTDAHLTATSPAIALGDPAVGVLTDYDGVTRGAAVDAGCYEYTA